MKNIHSKRYRVYYFIGDFWSSQGETRKSMFIEADSEEDAERFFKQICPDYSFGWVEEYHVSRN